MPFLLTAVLADGFYTDQILPCQQRLWSNITSIRQLGNNELKGLKFISRSILLQSELQYTKWGDWCSLSHISNKWRASPCPYTNIIIIERYRCWNTSTYAPQRWYLTINRVLTLISKTLYVFICAIVTQHWSWIFKFLTARQLFSPHEGDITIRKSYSKTIVMEMMFHKHPSRHLNYSNCMFRPLSW